MQLSAPTERLEYRRGMHRLTAFAIAASLCGCSLLTVRAPREDATAEAPRCTKRARGPIAADLSLAVVSGLLAIASAGEHDQNGTMTSEGAAGAVVATGAMIGFAYSAIVGYRRADDCQQAWDAHEAQGQ